MNLDTYLDERRDGWQELDDLLRRARGRPARLEAAEVLRLGHLYRAAAADLAIARRRFPGEPAVGRLEDLVLRARAAIYGSGARRGSVRSFVTTGYWRLVRGHGRFLLVSAALLLLPVVLGIVWAQVDPAAAARLVPGAASSIADRGSDLGLDSGERSAFASSIMTNNIRVTFVAFAGGVLLGLGTAAVLLLNGIQIGVLSGLAFVAGNGSTLVELIAPHGVLELSCIVVAGASGLRLGWTIVSPGPGPRGAAAIAAGRTSAALVVGTAPWLVLAGVVEGFVTPSGIGVVPAVVLGTALAAVFWWLVASRGGSDEGAGLEADVGGDARSPQAGRGRLDHHGAGVA